MLEALVRNTPYAWMSGTNRDEAFYQRLQIPHLFGPEVRGFFFNFQGRVVRPYRAIDERTTFDLNIREVSRRSRGCESGFKYGRVKVGDCGNSITAETG